MDTQAILSYQANILMEPHASKRVSKALSIGNLFNKLTNLIPMSYWHEFLDIVFFFKAINGLIYIDNDVIPAISEATRATRSSRNTNAVTFIPKRCKTATYQSTFSSDFAVSWTHCQSSYATNTLP